jgi:hypothetical protein
LNKEYPHENIFVKTHIFDKIKKLITLTAKAAKINANERKFCFEIFGYDFIIDKDFNVFLLEVNTNPGLEESSPLIKMLIPRMIDDAMRLTIDKLFPPRFDNPYSPYDVDGYSNNENLWDYVTDYL